MASSSSARPHRTPMPVGPIILWAEKAMKSTPSSRTSTGEWGTSCAPSATTTAPAAWAAVGDRGAPGLMVPSTLDMHETPTTLTPSTRRSRSSSTRRPSAVDRDVAQVEAAELLGQDHPRHDVGVVLHFGQEHGVAGPQVGPAPGLGDQVERLGRVLGEDHLVRRVGRADEAPGHQAGPLVQGGGLLGGGVDAAVHVGVRRLVVARHGVDDGLGLQRGGGRVEIHDGPAVHRALQQREVLAQRLDVERRRRAGAVGSAVIATPRSPRSRRGRPARGRRSPRRARPPECAPRRAPAPRATACSG